MKILHSADWHLCSPLQGRTPDQEAFLRRHLRQIPGKVAALCKAHRCDMMLLAGDLFDGPYDADTLRILQDALRDAAVPVFITPGNHDFCAANSPWLTERWPENVHIFTCPVLESVEVPSLSCRVYGAGFAAMDCPSLLSDFQAQWPIPALLTWRWVTSTKAARSAPAAPCAPGPAAPWAEAMTKREKRVC